jgi:hypothetical protein
MAVKGDISCGSFSGQPLWPRETTEEVAHLARRASWRNNRARDVFLALQPQGMEA